MGNLMTSLSGVPESKEKRGSKIKIPSSDLVKGDINSPLGVGLNTAMQGKRGKEIDYSAGLPPDLRSPMDSLENGGGGEFPEFACSSVRGRRAAMEDEHIAMPNFASNGEAASLFAVFDGHGGRSCASFLNSRMSEAVQRALGKAPSVDAALKMAFRELDEEFLKGGSEIGGGRANGGGGAVAEQGSTAVVVLVRGGVIYCANTGDSRAILCRRRSTLPLSDDHKPSRPDERLRIEQQGGYVMSNRVVGRLAVSRAFGDRGLKDFVISEPEVTATRLEEGDQYLLLGCDGLWDVTDNEKAAQLVRSYVASSGLSGAARALTTFAVCNGSGDNVTALLVDLNPQADP